MGQAAMGTAVTATAKAEEMVLGSEGILGRAEEKMVGSIGARSSQSSHKHCHSSYTHSLEQLSKLSRSSRNQKIKLGGHEI